jgi:hypothetical protein
MSAVPSDPKFCHPLPDNWVAKSVAKLFGVEPAQAPMGTSLKTRERLPCHCPPVPVECRRVGDCSLQPSLR